MPRNKNASQEGPPWNARLCTGQDIFMDKRKSAPDYTEAPLLL